MLHNPSIKHNKNGKFLRNNDVVNSTNVVSIRTSVNRFRRRSRRETLGVAILSVILAIEQSDARSIVLRGMHDYYNGANDDPRNEVSGA